MGGLIARVAISRYKVAASGLFTIGTPHSGSPASDALAIALSLRCLHPACLALRVAAQIISATKGGPAILDMTLTARAIDNLGLRPPGVPTWVLAGTAIKGFDPTGYAFPNDEAVGRSSALGRFANLGTVTPYDASLWHNRHTVFNVFHANNEFDDNRVLDRVAAADLAASPRRRPRARTRSLAPVAARGSAEKPGTPPVRISLTRQQAKLVPARTAVSLGGRPEYVLGRSPFSVACAGRTTAALAIGPGLYALPGEALACAHPTLRSARRTSVVVNLDDARVRAKVTRLDAGRLRIDVTSRRRLRAASVRVNGRTIAGRRVGGRFRITLPKPARRLNGDVSARVGSRTYRAPLQVPVG
jgi:hypothetical protein